MRLSVSAKKMRVLNKFYDTSDHESNWILAADGPRISVTVSLVSDLSDRVFDIRADALIDSGATISNIDTGLAEKLGLPIRGTMQTSTPSNHAFETTIYSGSIISIDDATKPIIFEPERLLGANLSVTGIDILLGCDFLSRYVFVHDGITGCISLYDSPIVIS